MGEPGELALHPHELLGVLNGLVLRLGHVDAGEIAAVFRAGLVTNRCRGLVVEFPDLLRLWDRCVECDIRIALLRRPDDRFLADHTRYPHARIRLLQWKSPRIDDSVLIVRALPAEWSGHGPGLDDQVVSLFEALAVVSGVHASRELLLSAAAYEPGYEPALGDHVDHGEFFGEADRILGERQRIAEHNDLDALGGAGQYRSKDIGFGLHAERRVVVLIQHDAVDSDFLGKDILLKVFIVEAAARDW